MNPSSESSAELVAWLSEAGTYSPVPNEVQHVETHISHVFLAGEHVYKLKKAVRFDFLDFSTLAAREQACREEVRLNRRLAPAIYLGVVPITRGNDGEFSLDGGGEIVDWLVHMRRLRTDLSLEELFRRGKLLPSHIDRLSKLLGQFYLGLTPLPIQAEEYRDKFLSHVRDNHAEFKSSAASLPRLLIDRVHAFQRQLLLLQPELIDQRVTAGKIIDGHGDLRPEHICLDDPPVIFDCIEFNAEFRRADLVDELAFLSAECDFLGGEWIGERLLANYVRATNDAPPPILWAFYKTYRACVRAKIADLRAQQLELAARELATEETVAHLHLADRYSAPFLRPLVLVIGGLPGSGKSTLARTVAEKLGAEHLATDDVRQEMFPAATSDLYTAAAKEQVYDELHSRAAKKYADGLSVVLDGNFGAVRNLLAAQEIAVDPRALFLAVECVCSREVAHHRIQQREQAGTDTSEATIEVHDLARRQREPWPAEVPHMQIDSEQPVEVQIKALFAALRREIAART